MHSLDPHVAYSILLSARVRVELIKIIRQNDSDFFLFIFQETSDVSFFHISGKDKRNKSQLSSKKIGKIDL